jgi:hypothetical protein
VNPLTELLGLLYREVEDLAHPWTYGGVARELEVVLSGSRALFGLGQEAVEALNVLIDLQAVIAADRCCELGSGLREVAHVVPPGILLVVNCSPISRL